MDNGNKHKTDSTEVSLVFSRVSGKTVMSSMTAVASTTQAT